MYTKKLAIPLIIVFLALAFGPLAYNVATGSLGYYPEVEKPKGECVEDPAWMRSNHMLLLQEWRTKAIRYGAEGGRIYHSFTYGKEFNASTNTCWECHVDKTVFCDRCHEYVGIKPECWDCHWSPGLKSK
ncbi:MAG: sulfate reduction electron transfer complex DsrMKJOP subunit DsrJ [Archaeoglobaceae archaeon]